MSKRQKPILAFSCTHAPAMHRKFVPFLKKVYDKYNCDRVVMLGDLVDFNAISYHEKSPSMPSAAEEFKQAMKQVRQLHKAFPVADMLIGNHDSLGERKAQTIGLPVELLKDFGSLFKLDGWKVWPRYHSLEINGVIFRHGDCGKGGQHAAFKNAIAEFQSVCQGHLHSQAGVSFHANRGKLVYGLQVGCGADNKHPAMGYSRVFAAKPILGCGVVTSDTQAQFIPMPM